VTDVYAAVEAVARDVSMAQVPTAAICAVLDVSRSGYYAWQTAEPSAREQELDALTPTVVTIFCRHRRRYGARRIAAELKDQSIVCSAKRVAKILRNQGLRAIQPRSFVPKTTDSRHSWATVRTCCSRPRSRRASMSCGSPTSPICRCGAAASATWRV
jgi:putative transposase